MSADLLRRAATRLRENAGKASKAPWVAAADGLVWPDCMGDPVSGSQLLENAYYIEMLHPPVALALAELLEHQADDISDERAEERTFPTVTGGTYTAVVDQYGAQRWDWTAALSVARAVLRESTGDAPGEPT